MSGPTTAARWTAENLNEYAAAHDAGRDVPGHRPGSPLYWFYGLAGETLAGWKDPACRALLSPSSLALIEVMEAPRG